MVFLVKEIKMPIPINPVSSPNQGISHNLFYSEVSNLQSGGGRQIKEANNRDASILMDIWLKASKEDDVFVVDDNIAGRKDIARLKAKGFVSSQFGSQKVSITERGRSIIAVMALGETNKMIKNQKNKPYTEIIASMDKRGKSGYRIPRYASNTSNNLNIKDI